MTTGPQFAKADDRRVFLVIQPSGGQPDFAVIARTTPYRSVLGPGREATTVAEAAVFYRGFTDAAVFSTVGHWLVNRLVFGGGWTIHVDAPDRDPIKIRCRNRAEAQNRAEALADDIAAAGSNEWRG